ncbi:GNAT family N-acetyltransferase [Corynebacterium diphtheriae]|nr:GNAT family N-acetyltransferase [Corynebacterium diphtheriae]
MIRRATLADAEAYDLQKHKTLPGDPDYATWLVEGDGAPVGYALAGPCSLLHPDVLPEDRELKRLYLLADHQKSGLGSTLIDLVFDWIGPRTAWLGVWAQRFYYRYGFSKAGEYLFKSRQSPRPRVHLSTPRPLPLSLPRFQIRSCPQIRSGRPLRSTNPGQRIIGKMHQNCRKHCDLHWSTGAGRWERNTSETARETSAKNSTQPTSNPAQNRHERAETASCAHGIREIYSKPARLCRTPHSPDSPQQSEH